MAEVIRMPRMSDTMEEGVIVGWLVEEGTAVEPGDTLAEVETDKATMELDSFSEGILLHIAVKEGSVPINGVIGVIGEEGEDWKAAIAASEAENGAASPEPSKEAAPAVESTPSAPVAMPSGSNNNPSSASDSRIKASPLARSMAKEAGLDLSTIQGSGDQGRIVKRDIEEALQTSKPAVVSTPSPAPAAPTPASPPPPAAPAKEAPAVVPFTFTGGENNFEEVSISQMRKVIARRLGESKFSAPHFYLTVEMNMAKVMKLRTKINEKSPTRISYNDLVVKAAAVALRAHPAINSSWMEDHIRVNKDINIGVAVAVKDGLLVPVIRYADMKTLSQINSEVRVLAGKAKEKKLQPNEMSGNTFTISNLGMFDIEEFTAIINPPDACIMAVGSIIEKPIVKNGKLKVGHMMKVTLSCDHRVVDGATGAKFLQTFKGILEDPVRLLI